MDGETGNSGKIRVLCVDDHALMREALSAVIRNEPDMLLAAEATSGREAIESFRLHRPDVTLMDLRLSGMSGIDALIAIRAEFPEARVIMLTTFESDADMERALACGAKRYLLKSMPPRQLLKVIREVGGRERIFPR